MKAESKEVFKEAVGGGCSNVPAKDPVTRDICAECGHFRFHHRYPGCCSCGNCRCEGFADPVPVTAEKSDE